MFVGMAKEWWSEGWNYGGRGVIGVGGGMVGERNFGRKAC